MEKTNYSKLSLMMFLQYAVWGAWLPVLAQYLQAPVAEKGLGFTGGQVGMILGLAGSIGAVTSPFIGNLADRKFSAERCLAVLMLIGGIVKWITAYQTSYAAWVILSIVYSIIYMPSISLSNSVAFANIKNADKEFPFIRVWGTIGWIAASWIFPWCFLLEKNFHVQALPPFLVGDQYSDATARLVNALKFSGVISLCYAGFCMLLPHTPPKSEVKELALTKSLVLFRKKSFLLLVIASLPISMIHQIYFMKTSPFLVHIGFKESVIGPVMSIGQFFEIGVMAALGFMLAKMGFRWTIVLGAFAYFLRYAIFGTLGLPKELVATSQALHGFCFSCFFAAGFIYVDRLAPEDIRHSAQTVFGIIILGLGPVIGGWSMGKLEEAYTPPVVLALKAENPMSVAGLKENDVVKSVAGTDVRLAIDCAKMVKELSEKKSSADKLQVEVKRDGQILNLDLPGVPEKATKEKLKLYMDQWSMTALNYSKFWYTLAAMGLVTALAVAALFKDETQDKKAHISRDIADEASEVA